MFEGGRRVQSRDARRRRRILSSNRPSRPEAQLRLGLLRPLQVREFALLWAGMAVSLLGDGFYNVAIAWQVYQLSNVPTALGTVGLVFTFSRLVMLLLGGVLSDRYDRRLLMMAGNTIGCVSTAALGGLSMAGRLELWQVWVLVAIYGCGTAIFIPAFGAVVPQLLPPELLAGANALDQLVRQVTFRLLGPVLGGVVIAVAGSGWAFAVDSASFAFAALTVALMSPLTLVRGANGGSAWREALQGFGYVLSQPWLWATMFLAGALSTTLIMGPSLVLLPYVVKNRLGGSASDLGMVLGAGGVAAILISAVVGQRPLPRRFVTWMYVGWTAWALPVALFGVAESLWQLAAASFVWGGGLCLGQIIWGTLLHTYVPPHLLGRVSALDWQISLGLVPLSYALTGPVADAAGPAATLVGAGVLSGATMLVPLLIPGVRDLESRAGVAPTEADRG